MTTVFTVGHSNHPTERLVELLRSHAIALVADVRSRPYSKWAPQYKKQTLAASLHAAGIDYAFLGQALGGRPDGDGYRDAAGRMLYERRAVALDFIAGVERLVALATERPTTILCAEEDPARCHRRLLVTPALRQRGLEVIHLRGDGRTQTDDELASAESQLSLFE